MCQKNESMFTETTSVTVLLRHYKQSSGGQKCTSGRSVSEVMPHFGNLYVYKFSALQKKSFNSWKKPTDLQCSYTTNTHLEKRGEWKFTRLGSCLALDSHGCNGCVVHSKSEEQSEQSYILVMYGSLSLIRCLWDALSLLNFQGLAQLSSTHLNSLLWLSYRKINSTSPHVQERGGEGVGRRRKIEWGKG